MAVYSYISAGLTPSDIFAENNSFYITAGLPPNDVSYEIAISDLKLAQIFYVYDQFIPSKASLYIKPTSGLSIPYFDVSSAVAIDALNFKQLSQADNKNLPYTSYDDFSAKGSVYTVELDSSGSYAVLTYPIKADSSGQVNLYLRIRTSTGRFRAYIYLNSSHVATIDQLGAPVGAWGWAVTNFDLPDGDIHDLKIQMRENGNALDRLVLSQNAIVPGNVNDYQSSFITAHLQVYTTNAQDRPLSPLYIYDYKTTLGELVNEDWYNFDMRFLDDSLAVSWNDKFALVLFSSGGNENNYLVWELTNNDDPYICGPSAIKT